MFTIAATQQIVAGEHGIAPFVMTQGFTQEQLQDLIYLGAFYYETLLRREDLIDDSRAVINGTAPYPVWEIYMLAGLGNLDIGDVDAKLRDIKSPTWDLLLISKIIHPKSIDNHDQLNIYRRYLPNAYIRSKASLLGALTLSKNITEFDAWRSSVLSGLNDDESNKVQPYLREVFGLSQKLVREGAIKPRDAQPAASQNRVAMNRNQRIALITGAVVFLVMLLVPPWHYSTGRPHGYHFLFWPPDRSIFIDSTRLFLQCVLVAAVTCGALLLLKSKRQ